MNNGIFGNGIKYKSDYPAGSVALPASGKRLRNSWSTKNEFVNYSDSAARTYWNTTSIAPSPVKQIVAWVTAAPSASIGGGFNAVTFGNGVYVFGGSASSGLRTSTDLITWVTQTSNFGNTVIRDVAYGAGLFTAVGNAGQLRTSTDGVTWVTRTSNFGTTIIYTIAHNGTNLWAAGGNYGQLATSSDGVTWTLRTSQFNTANQSINSIAFGNGLWVAVGSSGVISSSTDAVTWTARTSNTLSVLNSAFYGNGGWVVVGNSATVLTSTNAVTWVSYTITPTSNFNSVQFGSSLWMASGNAGFYTSTDAITWVTIQYAQASGAADVFFNSSTNTWVRLTNNVETYKVDKVLIPQVPTSLFGTGNAASIKIR